MTYTLQEIESQPEDRRSIIKSLFRQEELIKILGASIALCDDGQGGISGLKPDYHVVEFDDINK